MWQSQILVVLELDELNCLNILKCHIHKNRRDIVASLEWIDTWKCQNFKTSSNFILSCLGGTTYRAPPIYEIDVEEENIRLRKENYVLKKRSDEEENVLKKEKEVTICVFFFF